MNIKKTIGGGICIWTLILATCNRGFVPLSYLYLLKRAVLDFLLGFAQSVSRGSAFTVIMFTAATSLAKTVNRDSFIEEVKKPMSEGTCARTKYPQTCFEFQNASECEQIYQEEFDKCFAAKKESIPAELPKKVDFKPILMKIDTCVLVGITNRLQAEGRINSSTECEKLVSIASWPAKGRLWGTVVGGLIGGAIALTILRVIRRKR